MRWGSDGRGEKQDITAQQRGTNPRRWRVERNHDKLHPRHKGKERENIKEKG